MRQILAGLTCLLCSILVMAIGPTRMDDLKPGVYVLKSEGGSPLWQLNITKANATAKVYRVSGTIFGPVEAMNMEVVGTYDPESNKLKAKTLEIPGVGFKVLEINGHWDASKGALVVSTEGAKPVQLRYAGEPIDVTPRLGGTYRAGTGSLHFILKKSSNPDQLTVVGWTRGIYSVVMEIRGTYYIKQNRLTAFGEVRGLEDAATMTLDGSFQDGAFKVRYRFTLANSKEPMKDETGILHYEGRPELDPRPGKGKDPKKNNDPKKPTPEPSRGSLEGNLTTHRASAKIGETIKLNLSYNLKGREDDVVQESVALYGPSGTVLARSDKERNIASSPSKRGFDIRCDKEGTYTVRARIKGELTNEWKQETSFKIEPKKAKTDTGKAGSYGLVSKKVGKAAPAEDNVGQGYRASGSVSEGAMQISMTPLPGNFSGFDSSFTWTCPPSELKPGQVLELTCTAKCTRSQKDPPGLNLTAWFRFSGLEVSEQAPATVVPQQNEFSASATGKYKVKVPVDVRSNEITIVQGYTGWAWGSGGVWQPCAYTYRWGAKPMEGDPDPPTGPNEPKEPAVTATTMVQTTPDDDRKQIRAKLDPDTITLNAGEPSKIVDLTIAGFRTNTLDRVEVVFPQATDGWASLPGQIVVGGGSGSYDPANMGRPEHTDGYFFSARSTAPDSEQLIEIIVRQKNAGFAKLKLKVKVVAKPGRNSSIEKAWGGRWEAQGGHRWGTLTIYVNGNRLTGTFGDEGNSLLEGTVNGNVFTFTFTDGDLKGTGQFTLNEKGDALEGHYVREGEVAQRAVKFKKMPDTR